jgi:hypothetical protein
LNNTKWKLSQIGFLDNCNGRTTQALASRNFMDVSALPLSFAAEMTQKKEITGLQKWYWSNSS